MSSELASLIEANTRIDGSFPTPIPGLHLSRYSSRTQPGRGVQCPTLAIVAQGTVSASRTMRPTCGLTPGSSTIRKLPVLYSQLVLDRLLIECLWRQPA